MNFPFENITDYKIKVKSGLETYFYKLDLPDLEQMKLTDKERFLETVTERIGRLPENDFFKIYFFKGEAYLNSKNSLNFPLIKEIPFNFPLSPLFETQELFTDIFIHDDYFKTNFKYFRLISILSFPESEITDSYLNHLGDFLITFSRLKKKDAEKSLGKKVSMNSLGSNSGKNDLVSSKVFDQASQTLSDILDGSTSYFKSEIIFFVKGVTLIDLNHKSYELIKNLEDLGFKYLVETTGLKTILYHALPGVSPLLTNPLLDIRSRKMPTEYLTNLLPLSVDSLDDIGLELFSQTGNTLYFNPLSFDAPNFNMIISGESGQGKSFLASALVEYFYKKNVKLIVLDKGKSFFRLSRYYNAQNFSLKFNPLKFRDPHYLLAFVISVFPKEEITSLNEGIIFKTIKDALAQDLLHSFTELINLLKPQFSNIEYYFEEIKDYFESDEKALTNFTYVDLTLVPKKLIAPLIIFLMKSLESLTGTKRLVIDEAWDVLGTNSKYVAQIARESRKKGLGLITVTQNLKDFFRDGGTGLAEVILENSNYKISLYQEVPEEASFTVEEVALIKNLKSEKDEYSEFLIKSNRSLKVARFVSTCLQYELFNTEEHKKDKIEKYMEKHLPFYSYKEAFDSHVRMLYA